MTLDPLEQARNLAHTGRSADALTLLERASLDGNRDASFEGAVWLLRGDVVKRDLNKAREFTARGAQQCHPDAILMEIALTANGSGGTPDWPTALALLRKHAAQFEWLQSELALVDQLDLDATGHPAHRPQGEVLAEEIRLTRFANFLSPAECQHIANVAMGSLQPSTVFDPVSGRQTANPIRTSDGTVIGPTEEDLVVQAITRRIAAATETAFVRGEPISVLRYSPGQQYHAHFDAIRNSVNNRVKTVIVYLNDAFTGGGTYFPELNLTLQPRAGDAIAFDSLLPDGSLLRASRHAGLPVTQGSKWVATRWIREHRFDPWTAHAVN